MSQTSQESWTVHGRTLEQSKDIVKDTAIAFNLGEAVQIDRIGGDANENYSVSTKKGDFVIKIVMQYPKKSVEQEANYLLKLSENKLPVIPYLQLPSGESVLQCDDVVTVALPKADGFHPKQTKEVISKIGKAFGLLHKIKFDDLPPRKNWLRADYLSTSLATIQKHFPDEHKKFSEAFSSLDNFSPEDFPQSIVHGDMSSENCMFKSNELIVFLDWEEVGVSASLLDLATCIQNMCYHGNKLDFELYDAMVSSYESERPLTSDEKSNMVNALKYVGLTLSVWTLLQFKLKHPNSEKAKRYLFYWERDLDNLVLPS